jgi:transcriptional regulator with XRE-family HTH domain
LGQTPIEDNGDKYKFDGSKLRKKRKDRNFTVKALSELTGISAEDITSYETMQKIPSASTIETLTNALGVPDLYFYLDGVLDIRDIIPNIERKDYEFIVDASRYAYIVAAHKYFEDGITPEAMDMMRQALIGVYGQKKP